MECQPSNSPSSLFSVIVGRDVQDEAGPFGIFVSLWRVFVSYLLLGIAMVWIGMSC
jgi:hypothetical protein